jgi:hypothetical protein
MPLSTPPVSVSGDVSSEKEIVPPDEHHATPLTHGHYVPETHGQPENPARVSFGQVQAYSEIDSNPLPQLVFGDAMPEVVKPSPAVCPDAVREDFVSDPIPVEKSGEEPRRKSTKASPWYKRKSVTVLAIIAIVAIVGIFAVLFGTLGGLGVFRNNRSISSSTPSNQTQNPSSTSSLGAATATGSPASSSSTTSSASSASSSSAVSQLMSLRTLVLTPSLQSASPSATLLPQCTDYSKYIQNISFVTGTVGVHGVGFTLPKANSQEQCCGICFTDTPTGCNIWVWDPKDNPTVPCTIIMGWFGDNKDSQCPYGHTNSTAFAIQAHGSGIGYSGPCGNGGYIIPGS